MITLDTSAVFAALHRRDRNHEQARDVLLRERGPRILPAATLGILRRRLSDRMGAMVTITVELPDEVRQALDELAERTGRSRTELIHDAVRDYLVQYDQDGDDPGLPRSAGMIEHAEVTAEGFEDWLKANWRPEDDWGRT